MRRLYGDGPVHLIAHLAAFLLAGWAILKISGLGGAFNVLVWMVGAVVFHDAVLWPLYAVADRAAGGAASGDGQRRRALRLLHLRVPAVLSGVVLLVFAPLILGRGEAQLARVGGIQASGYAVRWLVLTAVLFAASGLVYALRSRASTTVRET